MKRQATKTNTRKKQASPEADTPQNGTAIRDRIKSFRRVKASTLKPSPSNWRTHPEAQQAALRGILAEVGYADALLCRELRDGSLELIDGHLRAETTPDQNVPVLVLDVTAEEAAKLLLVIDPLAAMAEADEAKLKALLAGIETDSAALQAMLDGLAADNGIVDEPLVEAPEAQTNRAEELREQWGTAAGQLWLIESKTQPGRFHRLLCGDSTKADDVGRLMGGEQCDTVVTDPPYGCKNDCDYTRFSGGKNPSRNFNGRARDSSEYQGIAGDDKPFDPSPWLGYKTVILWGYQFFAARLPQGTVLVWNKKRDNQLGVFLSDGELAWMSGGKGVYIFSHVWHGMDRESEAGEKTLHPSQKPVSLLAWCIEKTKVESGEIVLDPYAGSGTTICAAENLSRICYGLEISPAYCAVILQRLADMGLVARREGA